MGHLTLSEEKSPFLRVNFTRIRTARKNQIWLRLFCIPLFLFLYTKRNFSHKLKYIPLVFICLELYSFLEIDFSSCILSALFIFYNNNSNTEFRILLEIDRIRPGPDPYNRSERLNPNPKTCEVAILYGPKVHFCDRNSAIRILIFNKFHIRVHINKRRNGWRDRTSA